MEQQFGLNRQMQVLWRYRWWVALVILFAAAVALIVTSLSPPVYHATARLMAGQGQQRLAAIPSGLGGLEMTYLQDIGSQLEVIRSYAVLERAALHLKPELAGNVAALQLEVQRLEKALTINQVNTTNLVTVTAYATDPALARRQADAVAEAYVGHVRDLATTTIETALQDTTARLEELQKASVDLSISPALPRLVAQMETALPALQQASAKLKQLGTASENEAGETTGTVLTASQLSKIDQRIRENTLEANDIAGLAAGLTPVAAETDFAGRSSTIAVIESRTRALSAKINVLALEVSAARLSETDATVRDQLGGVEEQLQVAGATGQAVLDQVVTLYGIQEQYIAARAMIGVGAAQEQSLAREADANALSRIVEHMSILTGTLDTASGQVILISTRIAAPPVWQYTTLSIKTDAVTEALQQMVKSFQPGGPDDKVAMTRASISALEVQARTVSVSLSSLAAELAGVQAEPGKAAEILSVRELVGIAANATQSLGDDIAGLAEGGGDVSYTALDTLRQELQLALLSGDTTGTRVVDAAILDPPGDAFAKYSGVLLAALAGLLFGAVGVLGIHHYDRTVRDAAQVREQAGLAHLASVENVDGINENGLSAMDDDAGSFLESFRLLRTNLGLDTAQSRVLLVSSPSAGEGKTTIAVNLARAAALQGLKVLLIDGNLRDPGIAGVFGLEGETGLSDLLQRGEEDKKYLAEVDGVDVLVGGRPSLVSSELFSSPRLKTLLEQARKRYDVVIIDSPPLLGLTDARILARNADGVVMVLRSDGSNLDMIKEGQKALESAGVRVEGFVLNRVRASRQ